MYSRSFLLLYTSLAAVEALFAIAWLFALPSEDGGGLLGFSASRWLLALMLFALAAGFAWASVLIWRRPNVRERLEEGVGRALSRTWVYWGALLLAFIGLLIGVYLIQATFKFTDALILARLQRLLPAIAWAFLVSLQSLILFPWIKAQQAKRASGGNWRSVLAPAGIALAGLALLAAFVAWSRLGLRPDRTGWDSPGTPLLGTQVGLVLLVAILVWGLVAWGHKRWGLKPSYLDLALGVVIWLVAVALWQTQPLQPTYFSPRPQPPNWAYYPYSDAASHDLVAQNLLIGEGFTPISEKPLYSFFLAGLHAAFGQDYLRIVSVQILLLALFPVVLFALARRLGYRLGGLVLAGAVILRERNTIALSGDISVSHSKLLMTDLPTALALAFFTLLLVKWLQEGRTRLRGPFLLGAYLGFLVLLRSQSVVFVPLLLLLVFISAGGAFKHRSTLAIVALSGFLLAALPWLWRNYQANGSFGYSQPLQARYLAKQYSWTPEANDPGFPPDTPTSQFVALGFAHVAEFTRQYPGEVARFVSAHFLHNEVSSLLALPMRFDLADKLVTFYNLRPYWQETQGRLWNECCSLDATIAGSPYWDDWDGVFPRDAWLPLGVNLALIALGLGSAWRRWGWTGLLPLGLHLAYSLSSAVARVSGWRLILPADWVVLLYYCLGLTQLVLCIWAYLSGHDAEFAPSQVAAVKTLAKHPWRQDRIPQMAAVVFGLALLVPLAETWLPARYEPVTSEAVQVAWEQAGLANQAGMDVDTFLDQPGAQVLVGRALWPRYYAADMGEPGGDWPAFNPLPFSRLGFVLAGPRGAQVVLPLLDAPAQFPNAADVLVFGCQEVSYFRAAAVLFTDGRALDLYAGQPQAWLCTTD